jgi:hypothetical protein
MWDLTANTERVLFFYKLLFRSSPIVVISVPERASGEAYAGVTAATRELTDKFGCALAVPIPYTFLPCKRNALLVMVAYLPYVSIYLISNIEWMQIESNFGGFT